VVIVTCTFSTGFVVDTTTRLSIWPDTVPSGTVNRLVEVVLDPVIRTTVPVKVTEEAEALQVTSTTEEMTARPLS